MARRIGNLIALGALLVAGLLLPSVADAATLYITEFQAGTSPSGSASAQIVPQTSVASQTVALSGTSGASSAFNTKTHFVRLICDEGCSVRFGTTAPTALTTDMMLQQGQEYLFGVSPGWFIAGIANSAGNIPGGGGSSSDVNVADWGGAVTTLGQKAMAASVPVVVASDQSNLPTNLVQVAGASVATGHGVAAGAIRVELPTDGTGVVGLAAGSATVGSIASITTSVVPGTAATNLGKAEDAVHTSGDTGVFALGVATDGSTSLNSSGDYSVIGTDTAGNVRAVGSVASLATDSGNPIKVGCKFNASTIAPTDGQRVDCQSGSGGELVANARGSNTALTDGVSNTQSLAALVNSAGGITGNVATRSFEFFFNSSGWDRVFTCPNTAAVSVTGGNTTQIIALSGSTVIRVCSVSLGISLTGTVNVVTGTGSNCGTPTTISNPIPLTTGTIWQQSASAGGSLFRSTAGGEICIAAATGNVTGFITYAQY